MARNNVSCKSRPGAQDHEYLSEVDFLLREDGSRQVLSSKKICGSRKCCASCARRASRCSFPWRDHRHSGIRRALLATEERAHASHLRYQIVRAPGAESSLTLGIGFAASSDTALELVCHLAKQRTIAVARSDEEGFESAGRSGADPA